MQAAAGIATIYKRTASLLRTLPDQALLEMGLPSVVLKVVRCSLSGTPHTVFGRLDFARTLDGYKLLEFNADNPGLVVETFAVNRAICLEAGRIDANDGAEQVLIDVLRDAVGAGRDYVRVEPSQRASVVVTASGRYSSDTGVARYLCSLLEQGDPSFARHVALEELSIDGDGLYDQSGERIDVLFRVTPLQFLEGRLSRRGTANRSLDAGGEADSGTALFDLVERRRLALINPPCALLLESKALQVVIWNLFETGTYFNKPECSLIEKYMLPTYLDPPSSGEPYVVKPALGAAGDTVAVVNPLTGSITRAAGTTYANEIKVYQRYVELPELAALTELGPRLLRTVSSCFLVGGLPLGVCMRAGGVITEESAWVVPVYLSD